MLYCPLCGRRVRSRSAMKKHLRSHFRDTSRCPACGFEASGYGLVRHALNMARKGCALHAAVYVAVKSANGAQRPKEVAWRALQTP